MPIFSSKPSLLLTFALLALSPREAAAQAEQDDVPTGAHHAGQGGDSGGGGGYSTSVPLDLPPARGGLPVPVSLGIGGTRMGALGRGGDVQLSYVKDGYEYAHRRPGGELNGPATARRKVTLSLLGQETELTWKGEDAEGQVWVPQRGSPGLIVRSLGTMWRAYTTDGLTYTFIKPPAIGLFDLWLLDRIEGPAAAKVQLDYEIASHKVLPDYTLPLPSYTAVSIDLVRVRYNHSSSGAPKHEVTLAYGARR